MFIVFKGLFCLKSNCLLVFNDVKLFVIMMMDGLISECMVDFWICYLIRFGVDIYFNMCVGDFEFDDGCVIVLILFDGCWFVCDYVLFVVFYLML